MLIIISPAKKMRSDDSLPWEALPFFLPQTEELLHTLRQKTPEELRQLWKCNEQIAALNVERLAHMDLHRSLTPALLAYEGIQYQYMAPGVFTGEQFAYVQEHLRILSGFYGVLQPMDGVTPYRLEMQTKLPVQGQKDLYAYWGSRLAEHLFAQTDCIVNLASKEYSLCVSKYLPPHVRFVTCVFGEEINGKVVEKGTMCKMARGEMVRFMAENNITDPAGLKAFDRLYYRYLPERSDENTYVFLLDKKSRVL
ncbi:MAG: peroxide stress protein YaaA [Clostridia bacterium]|nr:peroxide stress protein YaaA [Clostridia bacterium]